MQNAFKKKTFTHCEMIFIFQNNCKSVSLIYRKYMKTHLHKDKF